MSTPPPGGWPPGPPPNSGPYGRQGFNPQQPAGWQQGSWPQQPSPPPQKANSLKWLLIAVAVLLVVAISVGATLLFTRDSGGGGGTTPSSAAASDFASAGDTGPVAVITDEPTCNTFNGVNNSLSDVQNNGWGEQRGTLGPQSEWTPEQRSQVQAVATAMRNSADKFVSLAKQTPHRVVRELYEQFIAYGRAYADSVPNYVPSKNDLATTNVGVSTTLFGICSAIESGSAIRAISLKPAPSPTAVVSLENSINTSKFMAKSSAGCDAWSQNSDSFDSKTAEWQKLDTENPASEWSPERRSLHEAALPALSTWADQMQSVGAASGNASFEDFALTASLYMRAYVAVGDNYVGPDSWLSYVGYKLNQTILAACRAAG